VVKGTVFENQYKNMPNAGIKGWIAELAWNCNNPGQDATNKPEHYRNNESADGGIDPVYNPANPLGNPIPDNADDVRHPGPNDANDV